MTEPAQPYIPSGRELDDGLEAVPVSRVRRLAQRLHLVRDVRRQGPKIRDFDLDVAAHVGERKPQRAGRATKAPLFVEWVEPPPPPAAVAEALLISVDSAAPGATGPQPIDADALEMLARLEQPPVQQAGPGRADLPVKDAERKPAVANRTAGIPRQTEARPAASPSVAVRNPPIPVDRQSPKPVPRAVPVPPADPAQSLVAAIAPELVAAWIICIAEQRSNGALTPAARQFLAELTLTEPEPAAAYSWWRAASGDTSAAEASGRLRDAVWLPASLDTAVAAVGSYRSRPLASFREQVLIGRSFDAALRDLRRRQREYPSIAPVVAAVEQRDRSLVDARVRALGYDSAGWHGARGEINAAIEAMAKGEAKTACPPAALPVEWLQDDRALALGGILSAVFRDRDRVKLADGLTSRLQAGLDSLAAADRASVQTFLTTVGCPL